MRLLHTMFRVVDLEQMIDFYTTVMGMRLLRRKDFPEGRFTLAFVGYGAEKNQTVLEFTHNWDNDRYSIGDAYGHIAIQCDDLEAVCARVRVSSGELVSEPHQMKDGPVMAFARDPEGYLVELLGPNVFDGLTEGSGKHE